MLNVEVRREEETQRDRDTDTLISRTINAELARIRESNLRLSQFCLSFLVHFQCLHQRLGPYYCTDLTVRLAFNSLPLILTLTHHIQHWLNDGHSIINNWFHRVILLFKIFFKASSIVPSKSPYTGRANLLAEQNNSRSVWKRYYWYSKDKRQRSFPPCVALKHHRTSDNLCMRFTIT